MGILVNSISGGIVAGVTSGTRFGSKTVAVTNSNGDLCFWANTDSGFNSVVQIGGNNIEEGANLPYFEPIHYRVRTSLAPNGDRMVYRASRGRHGTLGVIDTISRRNLNDGTVGSISTIDPDNGFTAGYRDHFAFRNIAGTTSRVGVIVSNSLQIYNQNISVRSATRGSLGANGSASKKLFVAGDIAYVLSDNGLYVIDVSAPGTGIPLLATYTGSFSTSVNCVDFKGIRRPDGSGYLFILYWNGSVSSPATIAIRHLYPNGTGNIANFQFNMPATAYNNLIGFDVHPTGLIVDEYTAPNGTTQYNLLVTIKDSTLFNGTYHNIIRGLKITVGTGQGNSSIIDYGWADIGTAATNPNHGVSPGHIIVVSEPSSMTLKTYTFVQDAAIISHSTSQTVGVGAVLTMSVTATGDSLSYQWKKNGVNISGATSSTYTISSTQPTDAATYTCTVSNSVSSVTTGNIVITISSPITITSQPQSVVVGSSTPAVFSVTVTGTSPTYQWRKNGAIISGATSSTYTINSPSASDVALYTVYVTNTNGTVVSNNAQLIFVNTPPQSQQILLGNSVHFSVTATGATSYQWKKNGVNISGATSSTYVIPGVSAGDVASYTCQLNNVGDTQSASLTIKEPGQINIIMRCGDPSGFITVSRQWYKNGKILDGQLGETYTEEVSQENGTTYYCELQGNENERQITLLYKITNNKAYAMGLQYLKFLSNFSGDQINHI